MDLISYDYTDVGDNPNKAFIFIHGWQGNKDSFKSISKILNVESCRFYFPEGPYLIDKNNKKRSWSIQISENKWDTELSKKLFLNFFDNNKTLDSLTLNGSITFLIRDNNTINEKKNILYKSYSELILFFPGDPVLDI